jgi:RHS repeat-associated protein
MKAHKINNQSKFPSAVARHLCFFIILVAALSGVARAQESCDAEDVKIGFQAKTCAYWDYSITLNGVSATGGGTGCLSFAEFPNLTNKAWTKLKVNKTYTVTAAIGLCITHINFDVPEGYVMYIDGIETNTIYKTNGGQIYSGDGSWSIVIRKACSCAKKGTGQSTPQNGSVVWDAGLGNLRDGRSAETISIREKVLSPSIYTPASLVYSPPANTSDVDVIRNGDGSLRQINAPQSFADVVVISASEYEIRYYQPANVGAKVGGVYTLTGQPYVKWNFANPNPATLTKLLISKIENSITTDKTEYTWDAATDQWTMTTGWSPDTQTYSRTETRYVSYPTQTSRTETFIVKGSDGQVVSKTAKTYFSFPWGEELVQEVVDPDGAALTTTYAYYENPSETYRYQKVQSIVFPDGSWQKYDYDGVWNISKITRPWKDLSMATATDSNSRVTIFGYTNSDNGVFGISEFPRILFDVEEKINGVTVRKSRFNRSIANVDPDMISVTDSSYAGSNNGVPVSLVTQSVTTNYRFSAPQFLANRIASVVYPDGRKDSFSYEQGNFIPNADPSLSQFIVDSNGLAERQTLIHGTTASPDGVAFKTTKEVIIRDQFGNQVLAETYIYNGAAFERVGWISTDYDSRGHVIATRNHKGELTTAVWNGERKSSEIDAAGIETTYAYDLLGRVATQTKKGIAAGGGFPGQPDIVTTFGYDAEDRQISQLQTAPGLSLSTQRTYDRAGRVTSDTDQAGFTTKYLYTNGGRTQTTTNPGGVTQISDRYLDGEAKSVTGTAVVARYFDYGVNPDGTRYLQAFSGSAGLSSPRWTKTTTDWVGRTVSVEKPGFTGVNTIQSAIYNSLGQLQKETTTANSLKLIADRLHEYNELGQEIRAGLDMDSNGSLTLASTDRINETDTVYEKVANDWFQATTKKTYLVDNNSTPTVQTQRERLNNFSLNGAAQTISEVTAVDVANNAMTTTRAVDRAAKRQTVTIDTPDSNVNGVSISINGLVQSSGATTPQTATTYAYDGLARQVSVTDPQSGTSTRTLSSTKDVLLSTNDRAGTTTYQYYDDKSVNAGRVKLQINALGKKVYFNYNARGEMVQTWGEGAYPLEMVYDGYGQRTELHTFRAGQNWSADVWPGSTTGATDVTRWIFQESTGLLTQKQDATLKGPAYTYDELGRMKTRVWARGITSTYGYDPNTGELLTITYSDTTPAVTFSYDRGGRQSGVIDAAGTHTRTFNAAGSLQTEQITAGILNGVGITVGYDSFLRRNSLQTSYGANTLSSQSYGYDASSRLETVTSGSQIASYAYYPNSGSLNTTTFTGGTNIARTYDPSGRLQNITTNPASDAPQSYAYTLNDLNQRTRVTREDGSYWSYVYNDRGELKTGKKYWADQSIVWGNQTEFNFDNTGNRVTAKSGGNPLGTLRQSSYTSNSLNQYTQRTVPGALDVSGAADTGSTVTVNNQATARKGDYFFKELALDNTSASLYPQINVVGAKNNFGAGGEDAITQKGGRAFLATASETFAHDDDGNLISDGRWIYTWDAENRLTRIETTASVPVEAKSKLQFSYDSAGRRIKKEVFTWNAGTSSYDLQAAVRFIYDNWNVQAELDGNDAVVRSYVWGNDVSNSAAGAGGIGGLLLIKAGGVDYQVGYDGNGNVGTLVKASTGTIAATYDYDPFGNLLKAVGEYAAQNPFRFSTKYFDTETGLVYYGARYAQPGTGRWLSRDPIGEAASANVYSYNDNDAINLVDPFGYQQNPYNDGWLGPVADSFKFKHYVKTSPNWDFASAAMFHSLHTVTLRVCNISSRDAVNQAWEDLKAFNHFTPNLAGISLDGDKGHFTLRWTEPISKVGSAMPFVGNSIDVLFHRSEPTKELFAVTVGDHPLVGVRKWWAMDVGNPANKSEVYLKISTEAYENTNGPLVNRLGRWWPIDGGHSKQNRMWSMYIDNIANWWKENKRATIHEKPEPVVEETNLTYNPYRGLLPSNLQNSQYYYDYNPF